MFNVLETDQRLLPLESQNVTFSEAEFVAEEANGASAHDTS